MTKKITRIVLSIIGCILLLGALIQLASMPKLFTEHKPNVEKAEHIFTFIIEVALGLFLLKKAQKA